MDGDRSEKPRLIGVSGKMGHGKDLLGNIIRYLTQQKRIEEPHTWENWVTWTYQDDIQYEDDFEIRKFADKLKDMVCLLLGCTREQLEDREFKGTVLGEEWDKWGIIREHGTRLIDIQGTEEEANERLKTWGKSCSIQKIQMTPRLLLQLLGTECGREILHPNIWANALFADYVRDTGFTYPVRLTGNETEEGGKEVEVLEDPKPFTGDLPKWIVTDARFSNEAKIIKAQGGILIRVTRPMEAVCESCGRKKSDHQVRHPFTPQQNKTEHPSETGLDSYQEWDYVLENNGTIEDLIKKVEQLNIV